MGVHASLSTSLSLSPTPWIFLILYFHARIAFGQIELHPSSQVFTNCGQRDLIEHMHQIIFPSIKFSGHCPGAVCVRVYQSLTPDLSTCIRPRLNYHCHRGTLLINYMTWHPGCNKVLMITDWTSTRCEWFSIVAHVIQQSLANWTGNAHLNFQIN